VRKKEEIAMPRKPRCIIQAVKLNGLIGTISADELLNMGEKTWGVLGDRPTDHSSGKQRLEANDMKCGSFVCKPDPGQGEVRSFESRVVS